MRKRLLTLVALSAVLTVTACTAPPSGTGSSTPSAASQQLSTGVITGAVMAPAGIIAAGGGNIIAAGGGNIIAAGGGNIIAAGGGNFGARHVLSAEEAPLANTEVVLADAGGNALPGIEPVMTDNQGQYKFEGVPAGFTVSVVAKVKQGDKDATLQTLAKSSELGATADISTATTLVAAAVVDGQSELGEFNAAKFKTAIDATKKNLKPEDLPDFSDRSAVLSRVKLLQETVVELKAAIEEIRADLKDIKASLEELKAQLSQRRPGQPMPGQPLPGQPMPEGVKPPEGVPFPPDARFTPAPPETPELKFTTQGRWKSYPVVVAFSVPGSKDVVALLKFNGPDDVAVGRVPIGLGHDLHVHVAGTTGWRKPHSGFVIPKETAGSFVLPLPKLGEEDGGTTAPASTAPSPTPAPTSSPTSDPAKPTRASVQFKLPQDGPFWTNTANYPMVVNFNVPDGSGTTVLKLQFASQTEVQTGDIPVDLAHHIIYRAPDTSFRRVENYVVPAGTTQLQLPRPAL